MNLKGVITASQPYPDTGEIFYLVDTNYRTGAQSWSTADHTGPLDLDGERNPGRVFYTAGTGKSGNYATDTLAIQAAIDAMVDFRGDALFWTPGAYAPLAAVTVDVNDARWLGRPVRHAGAASATITAGVAAQFTMTTAADRMEIAHLRFVPLTASHIFLIDTGVSQQHWHHFCYDATGIAADGATQMFLVAGTWDNTMLEDFMFITDAAQGPLIELDGTVTGLTIRNFLHQHNAGTITLSLLDVDGAGATGIRIGPGVGQIGADGVVTDLVDLADLTNTNGVTIQEFTGSTGYATAGSLVTVAGTTAEANLVNCYIATVLGGNGSTLYTA